MGGAAPTFSQELDPRAYAPSPTGANLLLLGYGHSGGDVVFDATLPIADVSASLNSTWLLYGRTFGLFGRSASAGVGLLYVWGSVEGQCRRGAAPYHPLRPGRRAVAALGEPRRW